MAVKGGATWVGKIQDQLTYKYAPSSGEIRIYIFALPIASSSGFEF